MKTKQKYGYKVKPKLSLSKINNNQTEIYSKSENCIKNRNECKTVVTVVVTHKQA